MILPGIEPLLVLSFAIPGQPKAWARANRVGKRMVKSAEQKLWAERIQNYFAVARHTHPRARLIIWPHDGPVAVHLTGYFELPEETPRSGNWPAWRCASALAGRVPCERVMDADNVMKAVKDALNKVAYTDDRRVFDERSVKKWALPEDARLEVTVHFYPEITEANYGI